MVRVKICGITNLEDALAAESEGADALGFIFTQKSPRCLELPQAAKITSFLGPFVLKVGVFMNQSQEEVLKIASSLALDILQFHGKESFAYCNFFKPKFKVIKVCFPGNSFQKTARYQKLDALMLDLPYKQKGKNQSDLPKFAWEEVKEKIDKKQKIIISGGLNCDNIKEALEISPYAVDVCRGVEKFVGKKDKKLLKNFIKKVKNEYS